MRPMFKTMAERLSAGEDLVLVTETGCEILNHVDKHWKTVG